MKRGHNVVDSLTECSSQSLGFIYLRIELATNRVIMTATHKSGIP